MCYTQIISGIYLSAVIVFCFVNKTFAQTSPPQIQLEYHNAQWRLKYLPSPWGSAATLHFSDDLGQLGTSTDLIFDVPGNSPPISLDVSNIAVRSRGFFSITEYAGLLKSDFPPIEEELDETYAPPIYDFEMMTEIGYPLLSGAAVKMHFRLLDGASGMPIALNGNVTFDLVTADGITLVFPYTISPSILPITSGVVEGNVTMNTAANLAGIYIVIRDIISDNPLRIARDTLPHLKFSRNPLKGTLKELKDYEHGDSSVWHHPLGFAAPLGGSFGEWRSKSKEKENPEDPCAGRPHFGIDLSAVPGTEVYPVKRGVVSSITNRNSSDGMNMVVVHGDGSASRYFHVIAKVEVDDIVDVATPAKPATLLARVASTNKNHLHLELRNNARPGPAAGAYKRFRNPAGPGLGYDPGIENQKFVKVHQNAFVKFPLIQRGINDKNAPEIKALYIWDKNPKDKTSLFREAGVGAIVNSPNGKVLVAQIVDIEGGPAKPQRLVPSFIDFYVQTAESDQLVKEVSFEYNQEADTRQLFQDVSDKEAKFGYVRRYGNTLPEPAMYQYWFKWNTRAYINHKIGPRKFLIQATDRAEHFTAQQFLFGPQLSAPASFVPSSISQGSAFDLKIRSFMGPFPSAMTSIPQDTIRISLDASSLKTWNVEFDAVFDEVNSQTRNLVIFGHDQQESTKIRVKRKPGVIDPTGMEALVITAASGVFPDIKHEIKVNIVPYSGRSWTLVPSTVENRITPIFPGFIGNGWGYWTGKLQGGSISSSYSASGSETVDFRMGLSCIVVGGEVPGYTYPYPISGTGIVNGDSMDIKYEFGTPMPYASTKGNALFRRTPGTSRWEGEVQFEAARASFEGNPNVEFGGVIKCTLDQVK